MPPQFCLPIATKNFPAFEGEKDELINGRIVGIALCTYLQEGLPTGGIQVPFFCSEVWGWWLQTEHNGFWMGLCIHADPDVNPDPERYALMSLSQAPK